MKPPPPPMDAVAVVGAAKMICGAQWIKDRHLPVSWAQGEPQEAVWWLQVLEALHKELCTQALVVGPVIARTVRFDEGGRTVTLIVETWGRGVADAEWGIPELVRTTAGGLAGCPTGGDLLVMPTSVGR